MVAFENAETNLEGNCLEVNVDVQTVVAPTDVHVFCYYSGVSDDSPN